MGAGPARRKHIADAMSPSQSRKWGQVLTFLPMAGPSPRRARPKRDRPPRRCHGGRWSPFSLTGSQSVPLGVTPIPDAPGGAYRLALPPAPAPTTVFSVGTQTYLEDLTATPGSTPNWSASLTTSGGSIRSARGML